MANTLIAIDNLLKRALVTTSSADTVYAPANLCDDDGSSMWRVNAIAANDYFSADMDEADSADVRGGGFEGADLATDGWTGATSGAGNTAAEDAAQQNSGAKSCKLHVQSSGYARATKVFANIPSGERRTVEVALRGDATATARAAVYCPDTAQYLKADGTWDTAGAAAVYVATKLAAAWETTTLRFVMPTYAASRRPLLSLHLIGTVVETAAFGDGWADDFRTWASVDFLGVHGHNAGPVTCSWLASATGAFAGEQTTVASPTICEDRFYSRVTTQSDLRYQRIRFGGTNDSKLRIGEACLAQAYVPLEPPGFPMDSTRSLPQIRPGGPPIALAQIRQEALKLAWRFGSAANRDDFLAFERRAGVAPIWLVPRDDEALLIYGWPQMEWSDSRASLDIWQGAGLNITPQPYPVIV